MRRAVLIAAAAALSLWAPPVAAVTPPQGWLFDDSHFHLTNYVQRGLTMRQYVAMMGTSIKRSTVFGIPLQQTWSYPNSGDFAPTYYLQTDASLYYYSFTDAMIATGYLSLPAEDRARLDPMITGFNPADMYAADHIRRVLEIYPGVFSGIGEFSIHKEFVSGKVAGETASLTDPALDRILDFAGEVGLVVIVHCDIDMPFTKGNQLPIYFVQMRDLIARHPKTVIIWAHTGLGRVVQPIPVQASTEAEERPAGHLELIESLLDDPRLGNLYFDISWDEVAKYALSSPQSIERVAAAFDRHPDRFLFGTDNVAPAALATDLKVFEMWAPIFARLKPATKAAITMGNYERLFDAARVRVRQWERANVHD
ncbi:MAG TPA: amidohydrolase family protein [Allosphingosinicella sp.]|jgi:hypothetical protein|nr:amidohydrolase family protein [Allosphingosinicella sp.]